MAEPTPTTEGPAYDSVGQTALWSYLTGAQDGEQWALLDNLTGDDLRDVARAAISLLRDANAAIALSQLALDGMTERTLRFQARDAALAFINPYMDNVVRRLGSGSSGDDQ